mgnify:CR=1 FL=1
MNVNNVDISKLPADVRKQFRQLQVMHAERKIQNKAKKDFLSFVKCVWPEFVEGAHHRHIAKKFNDLAEGKINRLIVNMPPRHTKSEFASFLLPAWMVGRNPKLKIIQATHTGELAIRFGRKAKTLIDSPEYSKIFETRLREDSQAAGRWETAQGGEYFAAGVGGAITGRGADLLIIDDPHSEQDAMSATAMESAYEWYTSGPRQRLQPGGTIVIVMTRWSTLDLTSKLIKRMGEDNADQWEVLELPAILDSGKPLWPEYWQIEELEAVKASIPVAKWNAQYMQNPTSEEGAIVRREWWQLWEHDEPPPVEYIIQSYDTAFSRKESADYSAITTWGVFQPTDDAPESIILLDSKKGRWDFPELKTIAYDEYQSWSPDMVLIEAQSSGTPLTQELRMMGIPVINFRPSRGNDKVTRMHSVAPMFEAGMVWAPELAFAEELIEECAAFPYSENDDLVDSMTQALMRFRQGNFISLDSDEVMEDNTMRDHIYY